MLHWNHHNTRSTFTTFTLRKILSDNIIDVIIEKRHYKHWIGFSLENNNFLTYKIILFFSSSMLSTLKIELIELIDPSKFQLLSVHDILLCNIHTILTLALG